ncbi:MAG TPA: hypothetical protein GXZ67_04210 [Clostridiaceae bacterium]|nr:hypothetical protein [Clostridiaceae bacterium]
MKEQQIIDLTKTVPYVIYDIEQPFASLNGHAAILNSRQGSPTKRLGSGGGVFG